MFHAFVSIISSFKIFLREQTRKQNTVHMYQVSHLGSIVSQPHSELQESRRLYENKVCIDSCVTSSTG